MSNITNNSVFIAISFNRKYKNVLNSAIIPAIEESGFTPAMANEKYGSTGDIYKDIGKQIYNSSIIITDVSKRYDDNGRMIDLSNIFYEIGLAHAIEKHVIILCRKGQEKEDMPYDLDRIRHISYDSDDLLELKEQLKVKIKKLKNELPVRFFDDLHIMSNDEKDELRYLRNRSLEITFDVYPPTADIFLNDRLLSNSSKSVYINPEHERNTLSIAAPSFFEYHKVLSNDELYHAVKYNNGVIKVKLDLIANIEDRKKRVSGWLRDRRIDTNNPVLMRAIGQYLNQISNEEIEQKDKDALKNDAILEIEELLKIAPAWYLAHNELGVINQEDFELSLKHYKMAVILNPESYIGYYNQACAYSRARQYENVIQILKNFHREQVLKSYFYSSMRLKDDIAFENIKNDSEYFKRFLVMIEEIDSKAKSLNY
jgi:hypothetical protein